MHANLGLMFERKAKISCNDRRKTVCGRLGKQTSAGLKITFVDMTYPGQRPELPSLSHHFLLFTRVQINQKRDKILSKIVSSLPFISFKNYFVRVVKFQSSRSFLKISLLENLIETTL